MDGLTDKVEVYCDREGLLQDGETLLIGVSGGADSICLFYLLSDICKRRRIFPVVAHIHHGIRGEEADRDERFVRELMGKHGVPYVVGCVDAPAYAEEMGLSLEEAARILRYRELERIREEKGAYAIALAHHRDDQSETVLMNLLRGTGPVGMAGILPRSGRKIRPLLSVTKKEILDYLEENNIIFTEDSTNSDTNYTRNRIRHEVFPLLETLYPGAGGHIASMAEDARIWREYIHNAANMRMELVETGCGLSVERYLDSPEAIREELIRIAVERVIPSRKDVSRTHYRMLESLFETEESGRSVDLPGGVRAIRTAETVRFVKKTEKESMPPVPTEMTVPGDTVIDTKDGKWLFSAEILDKTVFNKKKNDFFREKDYTKCFDYDKIKGVLLLRGPGEGDYFQLDETGKRKKLSRFYIDRKIPREERIDQLVLADGDHIVWAMPDRISAACRVTEKTDRVLKVSRRRVSGAEDCENERDDYQED